MHSILSAKSVIAAAVALGSLAAATGARAQDAAQGWFSVTIGTPVHRVQSAPVQVAPHHAYRPAHPLPAQPHHADAHDRREHARGPWGDADRDGIPNRHDRRDDRRVAVAGPWGDADHDGIPNRHDRRDDRHVVAGPWGDADRDGVPNRRDRAPFNPRFH